MKIRTRLLLALLLTAGAAFYFLGNWLRDDVKFRYFQILEDGLAETAHILAASVESESAGSPQPKVQALQKIITSALSRHVNAEIFGIKKQQISLRIYATDATGKVIYDSAGFGLGRDYSKWNDVYLTLKGHYGARSSRDDQRYPDVSIKYIAAPIRANGRIVGVVTAAKPAVTLEQVIASTKDKIAWTLLIVFTAFVITGVLVTYLITRPLDLLIGYVKRLRSGTNEALPRLGKSEIGVLGREFELMRAELDGRKYIESFVQMLTHEFKSPVAGILGASEILEGDLSAQDRHKFLGNITREAKRIQTITETLLQIATLENTRVLPKPEVVDLSELLEQLSEDFAQLCAQKSISLDVKAGKNIRLTGNYFFLYQALANLLQNALDFSPQKGTIEITVHHEAQQISIAIGDRGAGIPEFAREKIFDKFYSLERPDTQRKSTGLGLAFVRLVVELHGGNITVAPREGIGTTVVVSMPVKISG